MADELTMEISGDTDVPYMLSRVGGTGISFAEWDFQGDFGGLSEAILSTFAGALDAAAMENPPFYYVLPQLDHFCPEPETPLTFEVHFGFGEDRDEHIYRSSWDERVANEFELRLRYDDSGYDMCTEDIRRFKKFGAALRELANKIDVALTKAVPEEMEADCE